MYPIYVGAGLALEPYGAVNWVPRAVLIERPLKGPWAIGGGPIAYPIIGGVRLGGICELKWGGACWLNCGGTCLIIGRSGIYILGGPLRIPILFELAYTGEIFCPSLAVIIPG